MFAGARLLIWMISVLADPSGPTRFTPGGETKIFIFGLFGLIGAFGLSVSITGLWQVISGRPNYRLVWILLVLMSLLFAIAMAGRSIMSMLD